MVFVLPIAVGEGLSMHSLPIAVSEGLSMYSLLIAVSEGLRLLVGSLMHCLLVA